jgi:acyl carrier protein
LRRTGTQQLLADAWRELLGVEQVAPGDNFFDLGGSSLLAVELISRLRGRVSVELSPQDLLFDTLAQLAARIGDGPETA